MTWRVWEPQWHDVFVSTQPGAAGDSECLRDFERRWAGRVEDDDWQVLRPSHEFGWYRLQVRLPVIVGEHASEADAWWQAGDFEGRPHLVVRAGSPKDIETQGYGRRTI